MGKDETRVSLTSERSVDADSSTGSVPVSRQNSIPAIFELPPPEGGEPDRASLRDDEVLAQLGYKQEFKRFA